MKSTWRLTFYIDCKTQYSGWGHDPGDEDEQTLSFKDEAAALQAFEEAKLADVEEWVSGEDGDEPGPLKLAFVKNHGVKLYDLDGRLVDIPLALSGLREFVRVEQIYPNYEA